MTRYENEGYRPREHLDATLSHDDRSTLLEDQPVTGEELYRVRPPAVTAAEDQAVTIGETTATEGTRAKRNKKRITKAIKMLTSAVATVTIAATLSAGGDLADWADDFFTPDSGNRQYYSKFSAIDDGMGYGFSEHSDNSYFIQTFAGNYGFRIESRDPDVRLMTHDVQGALWNEDRSIYIIVSDRKEAFASAVLEISPDELHLVNEDEYAGTVEVPETGEVLNFRAMQLTYDGELKYSGEEFAALVDDLLEQLEFKAVDYDSWNRIQIGDTMFSTTDEAWYGIGTGGGRGYGDWTFDSMTAQENVDTSLFREIATRDCNDIHWTFYLEKGEEIYDDMLWIKPAQDHFFFSVRLIDFYELTGDDPENIVDYIYETGLIHYYLLSDEATMGFEQWRPSGGEATGPAEPSQPSEPSEPSTGGSDVPTEPAPPPVEDPTVIYARQYPAVMPSGTRLGVAYSHQSQNSGWVQFSMGEHTFRIGSDSKMIHIMLRNVKGLANGMYYETYQNSFKLMVEDRASDFKMVLYCALDPINLYTDGEMELLGTMDTVYPGVTLHYSAQAVQQNRVYQETEQEFQAKARELISRLQFQPYDPDSWNKMLLGDTLISDMNQDWAGFSTGNNNFMCFEYLSELGSHDLSQYRHVITSLVNGITWHFYYDTAGEFFDTVLLWCVPDHEEIALGLYCYPITANYFEAPDFVNNYKTVAQSYLEQTVDYVIENALTYIDALPDVDLDPGNEEQPPAAPEVPQEPVVELKQLAQVLPAESGLHGMRYDAVSQNSNFLQLTLGDTTYRFTAARDTLYLMQEQLTAPASGTYQTTDDNSFTVRVEDTLNDRVTSIRFWSTKDNWVPTGTVEFLGDVTDSNTNHIFYYRAVPSADSTYAWEQQEFREYILNLMNEIQFARANFYSISRVQIGETLMSDLDQIWSGTASTKSNALQLAHLATLDEIIALDWDQYTYLDTRTVNNITWHLYLMNGATAEEQILWCIPAHEEIALGLYSAAAIQEKLGDVDPINLTDEETEMFVTHIADKVLAYIEPFYGVETYGDHVNLVPPMLKPYAQIRPHDTQLYEIEVEPVAEASRKVQFTINDRTYRLEGADDNIYMTLINVVGQPLEGENEALYGSDYALIRIEDRKIRYSNDFMLMLENRQLGVSNADGTLVDPYNGVTFYYNIMNYVSGMTDSGSRSMAASVVERLVFTPADDTDWPCMQVGETMFVQTDAAWRGFGDMNFSGAGMLSGPNFEFVAKQSLLDMTGYRSIMTTEVNGINWTLWYDDGGLIDPDMCRLIMTPEQEEIALGVPCMDRLISLGYTYTDEVDMNVPDEFLQMLGAYAETDLLSYFYLMDN